MTVQQLCNALDLQNSSDISLACRGQQTRLWTASHDTRHAQQGMLDEVANPIIRQSESGLDGLPTIHKVCKEVRESDMRIAVMPLEALALLEVIRTIVA